MDATNPPPPRTITLAWTGASGLPYGVRLLEHLLAAGCQVHFALTQAAHVVARQEMDWSLPAQPQALKDALLARCGHEYGERLHVHGLQDWFAPPASGTGVSDAMVICPCTMGTLAAVAAGLAQNLIERAADVSLKERRPLILVPREAPLSALHLENMLRLARAGAVILPPMPAFYTHPQTIDDLLDFTVARILDHLGLAQNLLPAWPPGTNTQED